MPEEPIAYTLGDQPFLGLTIYLDSKPLIPRVETEWWTEQLLQAVGSASVRFLDVCAGSGAIGCAALKLLPQAQVYFGEIDPAHKATIEKNIRENGLDLPAQAGASRAHIGIGNLFEPFPDMQFDVIAANPPYIPTDRELPRSVSDYEPAVALRAGTDGLEIIRRIAKELPRRLSKSGTAWIECDEYHAEAAQELFRAEGCAAKIRTDQYEKPRVIVVSLP